VFDATTVNEYVVPLVNPDTTQEVADSWAGLQVAPPGVAVTTTEEMAGVPLLVGAVHDTVAVLLPGTTFTFVLAPGTANRLVSDDGEDATESPLIFVAFTVKVYAVSFDKPLTVQ